jgi:uncharacterized protein YnzC (UPF0291/DUF896 family)
MSEKFKYYAIIGNNGYGMTKNWSDIVDNAEHYQAEWHKGFSTKDEAYNWILLQAGMRHNLNQNGVCDLNTLEVEKFIFLDENYSKPHTKKHAKELKIGPIATDTQKENLIQEFLDEKEALFQEFLEQKEESFQEFLKNIKIRSHRIN